MYINRYICAELRLLSCLCVLIVLVGCSSPPSTQSALSTKKSVGVPGCQPPSPITSSALGQPEVRGTTSGKAELWALLFQPLVAKQEEKIVWHMTGNGDMHIVAQKSHDIPINPKWIHFHDASNWKRPGAEWGTGFILPKAGCWDFYVNRGTTSGNVWLLVK